MVERYRPRAVSPPTPATKRKAKPKPQSEPRPQSDKPEATQDFTFLAREVLTNPPIRHRTDPPEAGLSVFEFVLAVVCVLLARRARATAGHQYALRAGKNAMLARRNQAQPVGNQSDFSAHQQFEAEGSAGYTLGRARFYRRDNGKDVSITSSRAALLRSAGLSRKSDNHRRVAAALDRLTHAVRKFPPVLSEWRHLPNGDLNLIVDGAWLPLARFRRVPLPLPTSGPIILALYLFLIAVEPRGRTSINTEELYRRMGVRMSRPAHAERALRFALERVNEHRLRLKLPAFAIVPRDDGRLSFRTIDGGRKRNPAERKHSQRPKPHRTTRTRKPGRRSRRDDEGALLRAENQERERLRRSRGLAPDEDLDDDEIEDIQFQEERRRESDRQRQQEEATRAQFRAMTERLGARP